MFKSLVHYCKTMMHIRKQRPISTERKNSKPLNQAQKTQTSKSIYRQKQTNEFEALISLKNEYHYQLTFRRLLMWLLISQT